jgi:hypothetical protein
LPRRVTFTSSAARTFFAQSETLPYSKGEHQTVSGGERPHRSRVSASAHAATVLHHSERRHPAREEPGGVVEEVAVPEQREDPDTAAPKIAIDASITTTISRKCHQNERLDWPLADRSASTSTFTILASYQSPRWAGKLPPPPPHRDRSCRLNAPSGRSCVPPGAPSSGGSLC